MTYVLTRVHSPWLLSCSDTSLAWRTSGPMMSVSAEMALRARLVSVNKGNRLWVSSLECSKALKKCGPQMHLFMPDPISSMLACRHVATPNRRFLFFFLLYFFHLYVTSRGTQHDPRQVVSQTPIFNCIVNFQPATLFASRLLHSVI